MTPSSGSGRPRSNKRLAWVAAVVGLACCGLLLPCTVKVRETEGWTRSAYSLKNIGRALHDYQEVYGRLPPAVITNKDGKPLYSWRVELLPFLEQDRLYKQIKRDEPWDSPHNKPLLEQTPRCYRPLLGGDDNPGLTRYQVFVGPGTAFEGEGHTLDDFTDAASTILVAEATVPVPWAKPVDLIYAPDQPLPLLGGHYTQPVRFLCYEIYRKTGFNACFADGTTRYISSRTDAGAIRALIARKIGE